MSRGALAPRERDIPVNGITLRAVTWGDLEDPARAVMLVHGITANGRCWWECGPELAARGWFPIALDLRGRGQSDKPPHGYGLPFHADDILAVCDHFGLESSHYVGHSLGGLIGLYLAAVHPGRMGRFVLVDAGGKLPPDAMEAIGPALARLGVEYPSLDAYLDAMLASPHFAGDRPFWERYFRHDAEVRPDGTAISVVPRHAITEEQASLYLTRTDILPDYVKAPTLIVRATEGLLGGERGQILPAAEAERLRGIIPDSHIVEIAGANHYSIVLADGFIEEVAAFLGEGRPVAG
ncbi:MAG: alpha/beta hydrolase [Thermomicrobiales bacterium]